MKYLCSIVKDGSYKRYAVYDYKARRLNLLTGKEVLKDVREGKFENLKMDGGHFIGNNCSIYRIPTLSKREVENKIPNRVFIIYNLVRDGKIVGYQYLTAFGELHNISVKNSFSEFNSCGIVNGYFKDGYIKPHANMPFKSKFLEDKKMEVSDYEKLLVHYKKFGLSSSRTITTYVEKDFGSDDGFVKSNYAESALSNFMKSYSIFKNIIPKMNGVSLQPVCSSYHKCGNTWTKGDVIGALVTLSFKESYFNIFIPKEDSLLLKFKYLPKECCTRDVLYALSGISNSIESSYKTTAGIQSEIDNAILKEVLKKDCSIEVDKGVLKVTSEDCVREFSICDSCFINSRTYRFVLNEMER